MQRDAFPTKGNARGIKSYFRKLRWRTRSILWIRMMILLDRKTDHNVIVPGQDVVADVTCQNRFQEHDITMKTCFLGSFISGLNISITAEKACKFGFVSEKGATVERPDTGKGVVVTPEIGDVHRKKSRHFPVPDA